MHPKLGFILMLHRVVEQRSEGENRELEVTPQYLEQTIEDYRRQGYRFVTIDEACDIMQKNTPPCPPQGGKKGRFVCLTFDDGYRDTYITALPLLKRLNIPFAVYVSTGFIDNELPMWWYPNEKLGLSKEELIALDAEPLSTIGAHTISHPRLSTLTEEDMRKEIVESKHRLEEILGHPIKHFSYPHGDYNTATLQVVKDAGFSSALKAWGGNIREGDASPFELPRIELKEP